MAEQESGMGEKDTSEAQPGNEAVPEDLPITLKEAPLKGNNIPWHVVEIMESIPENEIIIGFIRAQVNTVVVTRAGFYGHLDGSVQRLPMKLIDNF